MKVSVIRGLISRHDYLTSIEKEYTEHYEWLKSFENVRIKEIRYDTGYSQEEAFRFNSNHVVDPKPFIDAIGEAIENIRDQIREIEDSLPTVEFDKEIEK